MINFNLLEGNYSHFVYVWHDGKFRVSILKNKSTFELDKAVQNKYDDDKDNEDDEDEQIDRKKRIPEDDGSSSLIAAVRSDYAETISECKELIISYLNVNFSLTGVVGTKGTITEDFSQLMESIHPFFSEEVDYGHAQKITPAKAILVEQLHYELFKMYKKQPFDIEETVKAKVLPIITSVLETDDERTRLTEAIDVFKNIIAEEFIVNNSLLYLKSFLDNVKAFLYLMSTPLHEKMTALTNSLMEQFIDILDDDPYRKKLPVTQRDYNGLMDNLYFYYDDLKSLVLNNQIDNFTQEANRIYGKYDYDDGCRFTISSFQEAAYLQLFVIVQNDSPVKICEHCKKLFIPKAPQSKYCQYVFELTTGDRCCDIAAKHKNDFWHNSKVYKRRKQIRGRFYSKTVYVKYEYQKEQILGYREEWLSEANTIKNDFLANLISEDEAISQMEEQFAYYVKKIESIKKKFPQ